MREFRLTHEQYKGAVEFFEEVKLGIINTARYPLEITFNYLCEDGPFESCQAIIRVTSKEKGSSVNRSTISREVGKFTDEISRVVIEYVKELAAKGI